LLLAVVSPGAALAQEPHLATLVEAAQSGDPIASFNLGLALMATEEISVAQQRAAADAFALAARRGLPAAMANYGLMFFEGRGVLQDFTEGYAWLTVAVSMGLPDALELRDQLGRSMTVGQINAAQSLAEGLWQEITGRAP
jgi:TPR repeat protein